MTTRVQLIVRGIVQDVGFRPYVCLLARRRALRGQVCNSTTGVCIEVEGDGGAIAQFINELRAPTAPLSHCVYRVPRESAAGR
jgi:hydrogenase maturation protein HypF